MPRGSVEKLGSEITAEQSTGDRHRDLLRDDTQQRAQQAAPEGDEQIRQLRASGEEHRRKVETVEEADGSNEQPEEAASGDEENDAKENRNNEGIHIKRSALRPLMDAGGQAGREYL